MHLLIHNSFGRQRKADLVANSASDLLKMAVTMDACQPMYGVSATFPGGNVPVLPSGQATQSSSRDKLLATFIQQRQQSVAEMLKNEVPAITSLKAALEDTFAKRDAFLATEKDLSADKE
jgi:hypothetical protein